MGSFNIILAYGIAFQIVTLTIGQQVAPGVPPDVYKQYDYQQQQQGNVQYQQQYQGQPQPNVQYGNVQYQQGAPNGQYQQGAPNVQYQQQPPQQQQQQQQQYQQVPVQQQPPAPHGHDHDHPQPLGGNVNDEREHIQGHVKEVDTSKMSEQELQFHYFKMHDSDNNNKLDGSELIKSLIHWHDEQESAPQYNMTIDALEIAVDDALLKGDVNLDGMISWEEYMITQKVQATVETHVNMV